MIFVIVPTNTSKLLLVLACSSSDIDDCADHECLHGSVCVDGVQEYTCQCRDSYTGQFCESGKK